MKNRVRVKHKGNKAFLSQIRIVNVYISATFNNVIITITTTDRGNVLCFASGGSVGLKGSKKSTPYAGTLTVSSAMDKLLAICPNVNSARIIVKGPGSARESAIRRVVHYIQKIVSIQDVTSIPHNGCTPPNPRSV